MASEVVQGVSDGLRWAEVRWSDGRHTAVAHRWAAVTERGTALDLNVGSPRWVGSVGVERRCSGLLAAESGAPFDDEQEPGAVVAEEDRRIVDRSQWCRGSAVCTGQSQERDDRPHGWAERVQQRDDIGGTHLTVAVHIRRAAVGRAVCKDDRDQRRQIIAVYSPITVDVAGE